MEEIFDIIDTQGNPTGETVTREKAHAEGIPHRTAHIWIIREKYGRTEVLLQKRSMNKDSFPGKFDTSSAGHIQAGDEPLESALRELGEELGIQATPEQLVFAGTFPISFAKEFHGKMFRDEELAFVYIYDQPVDIADLVLQKEEVEAVEWFALEETYAECQKSREKFCVPSGGLEIVREFMTGREARNGNQFIVNGRNREVVCNHAYGICSRKGRTYEILREQKRICDHGIPGHSVCDY